MNTDRKKVTRGPKQNIKAAASLAKELVRIEIQGAAKSKLGKVNKWKGRASPDTESCTTRKCPGDQGRCNNANQSSGSQSSSAGGV